MVLPEENSATTGKTAESFNDFSITNGRLSLRYASAPDCQALIQSRKRQLKPSRAQEQKQAGSRVYSPEPTYVRPTTCSPTRSRFESPRKGIGKSKPFACTADARKAVHLT